MVEAAIATPKAIALRVEDLSVTFQSGAIAAVRGISFDVRAGETLGIVGESGSGKSVTGLALMRLLAPQSQIKGRIELGEGADAVDVLSLSPQKMRSVRGNDIAMVFQEPMTSLNPIHRVGSQIAEAIMQHRHLSRGEAHREAVQLLQEVGIPDPELRARAYPHQLSGGMRQRVMIAIALSCRPRLLIADEPTTALDVTIQAQIIDLLTRLKASRGTAMIFVTHDLPLIRNVADQVAVMYAGQIVERGSVEDIFAAPRHPYTQALLRSSPELGQRRSERRLQAIAGTSPSPANQPKGCKFHPRCPHFRPGQCDTVEVPLVPATPGHSVRCLFWREIEPASSK